MLWIVLMVFVYADDGRTTHFELDRFSSPQHCERERDLQRALLGNDPLVRFECIATTEI